MPRPLAAASAERLAALRWVLTDIDDTLTEAGRLPAAVLGAMQALETAGIAVVPVTGRPAGWCDAIARHWPVAAVVGENGALWYAHDLPARRMRRWYAQDECERQLNHARVMAMAADAIGATPGARLAADQPFRLFDVAVDFAEDVGPLPLAAAARIAALFEARGATARVSSIHVNAWIGGWDKLSGVRAVFGALWEPFDRVAEQIAFVGDSGNDAPLFAALDLSVGVANVLPFLPDMATPPNYVTKGAGGSGFVEFADFVLAARSAAVRAG